eukprot:Sdes_comp19715_c1_seq1m11659
MEEAFGEPERKSNCVYSILSSLKHDSDTFYNRLMSVYDDAKFVAEISGIFPDFPLVANLRCGAWYHPEFLASVYFKSTDGHNRHWDFSLKRLNLHLLNVVLQHGGCIVVDSTRKGRMIPDSLSKTVPIWCAVLNRAVVRMRPKDALPEFWEASLHVPPRVVCESEKAAISEFLDAFVDKLLSSGVDLSILGKLHKPLRPLWLTQSSTFIVDLLPNYSKLSFFPILCLTASQQVKNSAGLQQRAGYVYMQGSADDHELWSCGLTCRLFWEHHLWILESSSLCSQRVFQVVKMSRSACLKPFSEPKFRENSLANSSRASLPFDALQNTGFFLAGASLVDESQPRSFDGVVVSCGLQQSCIRGKINLQESFCEGKRASFALQRVLPRLVHFILCYWRRGFSVLVAGNQGKDSSAALILACLLVADVDETFCENNANRHQNLPFDVFKDPQEFSHDLLVQYVRSLQIDKKKILKMLSFICKYRPCVSPSRHNMKVLNRFFMSDPKISF